MTIAYNWKITETNHQTSDEYIFCAHWTATAVDGDYTASVYATCNFAKPEDNLDLTPYDDITEQDVLGWVWANGIDKDATEATLAAQIELQKHPVQEAGVPWAAA